jgi:uncharacterized protein (DUF302 family)
MRSTFHRIALAAAASIILAACGVDDDPADDAATDDTVETDEPAPAEDDPAPAEDDPAPAEDESDAETEQEAEEPGQSVASGAFGVLAGETDASVDETVTRVEDALGDAPGEIAFDVDHAQAADEAGLELSAIRLLVFGDPEVGTPLLQDEPLMGLDLPAKLLVWEIDGTTLAGVNDPPFLALRHGLDPGLESLVALDEAQRTLLDAAGATGVPERIDPGNVTQGIEVLDSADGFDETLERARDAIEAGPPELVAEVDHAAAAADAGLELADSTLLVFGNPEAGTPLMSPKPSVGIDLPQKLLIYDDDGQTRVAYNEPAYLRSRHLLTGLDEVLAGIDDALAELATTAAGN